LAACEICKERLGTEAVLSPCTSVSTVKPHPNNKSKSSVICRLSFVIIISNIIIITNNTIDSSKTAVPKDVMPPIAYHFHCLNPIINFFHVISTTKTHFFNWYGINRLVCKGKGTAVSKQARYRPKMFQHVEVSRISRLSACKGGKVISPKHWPPLPSRKYPWYLYLLGAESSPMSE
jgi:hypothetical protein